MKVIRLQKSSLLSQCTFINQLPRGQSSRVYFFPSVNLLSYFALAMLDHIFIKFFSIFLCKSQISLIQKQKSFISTSSKPKLLVISLFLHFNRGKWLTDYQLPPVKGNSPVRDCSVGTGDYTSPYHSKKCTYL